MTYRDLKELLKPLDNRQLDQEVIIYDAVMEDFVEGLFPVLSHLIPVEWKLAELSTMGAIAPNMLVLITNISDEDVEKALGVDDEQGTQQDSKAVHT